VNCRLSGIKDSRVTTPTVYMTASMVLKTTDPRARPILHFFETGYSEMAMPALRRPR
jgi:hypothetical protein